MSSNGKKCNKKYRYQATPHTQPLIHPDIFFIEIPPKASAQRSI